MDIVCARNISINTVHEGDDDDDYNNNNNNNNNNNKHQTNGTILNNIPCVGSVKQMYSLCFPNKVQLLYIQHKCSCPHMRALVAVCVFVLCVCACVLVHNIHRLYVAEHFNSFNADKKPTRCHLCVILYFSFTSCSTCSGQPCAHLQELRTA